MARAVGEDLEEQRLLRIRVALKKKLPKLLECGKDSDVTILILEWSDVALTNQVLIAQALETALGDEPSWPDHILIADTTVPRFWHFFRPLENGVFSIDMEYIEIEQI